MSLNYALIVGVNNAVESYPSKAVLKSCMGKLGASSESPVCWHLIHYEVNKVPK